MASMTTPAERLAALDEAVRGPDRERTILLALEDDELPVRERAIRLAARYVEPAVLGAMVADGENAVRRNAGLSALERQGPYAVPHLTVMLGDPDPELIMFALQSLARVGYPPAGRSILRGRAAVPPVQVGELADVMDLHIHRGTTRLAGVRQNPLEQFGAALALAGQGAVFDVCR